MAVPNGIFTQNWTPWRLWTAVWPKLGLGRPSGHLDARPNWILQVGTAVPLWDGRLDLLCPVFARFGTPGSFSCCFRTWIDADICPLKLYLHEGSLLGLQKMLDELYLRVGSLFSRYCVNG